MSGTGPPPGAPADAVTLDEAAARWDSWRARVWRVNAQRRGQGLRARLSARLTPGSRALRVVTTVVEPVVVAWRRHHPRSALPAGVEFPDGAAAMVEHDAGLGAPPGAPGVTEVVVASADANEIDRVNAALASASGWVALRAPDDDVFDGALAAMAAAGAAAGAVAVYADQVGADGSMRWRPRGGGPVGALGADRVGSPVVFDAAALASIGGLSIEAGRGAMADAVARLIESGRRAHHLARVVARAGPSVADAAADAARAALARRAWPGAVDGETGTGAVRWRPAPRSAPRVAIVVPTRDRVDLLRACLESVRAATDYANYEIVVVDNDSADPATHRYLAGAGCRVVAAPGPFNYAAIVNRGVRATDAELVVTLNNDVTVAQRDWLDQMVGAAQLPGVGVVGLRLDGPDGLSRHEGIAIAPYPQHLRRDLNYVVPDAWIDSTREASAVTGACQLFSRALFDELGGLDESLAVVHNDVDFCLRAGRLGRSTLYLASVTLTHAESSTRGSLVPDEDVARFIARWDVLGGYSDPFVPERLWLVGDVVRCVDRPSVG